MLYIYIFERENYNNYFIKESVNIMNKFDLAYVNFKGQIKRKHLFIKINSFDFYNLYLNNFIFINFKFNFSLKILIVLVLRYLRHWK